MQAERRNPSVDVSYLIFQARKAAEDSSGSRGQMSAVIRVSFEKYMTDARKYLKRALTAQVAFWSELMEPRPDLTRCHMLCAEMNLGIAGAEHAFKQLLAINSQSLLALRLYADFTLYVVNNADRANVLIAEAERLEDQQARDHQKETGNLVRMLEQVTFDVMADNTALFAISASPSSLGTILSVSPYATKMFGMSRLQMERRNIRMLVPSPIAEHHDAFLRKYLVTGTGTVVDYTRTLLAVHRQGYIFPVLLWVREQPASDGPPAFVGIMRAMTTAENHILMRDDYTLTAASQASLVALGVDPATLASGECKMQDWVLEWDAVRVASDRRCLCAAPSRSSRSPPLHLRSCRWWTS